MLRRGIVFLYQLFLHTNQLNDHKASSQIENAFHTHPKMDDSKSSSITYDIKKSLTRDEYDDRDRHENRRHDERTRKATACAQARVS